MVKLILPENAHEKRGIIKYSPSISKPIDSPRKKTQKLKIKIDKIKSKAFEIVENSMYETFI